MDDASIFGRGVAFPPRIGPDGRWAWSEGAQNIREAIQITLLTGPGERLLLQSFGGGLARYLFEPNIPATHRQIQERVRSALRLWEPRIAVESVRVTADPADEGRAIVTIEYGLVASGERERLALSVPVAS